VRGGGLLTTKKKITFLKKFYVQYAFDQIFKHGGMFKLGVVQSRNITGARAACFFCDFWRASA
jgi:hypothetical protein